MTREEQIAVAFDDYSDERKLSTFDDFEYTDIQVAFEEGAEWADNHPKSPWISIDEDLPCNHEELIHFGFTNNVLVIDDKQNTFIAFMKKYKDNEWIWDSTNNFVFLPLITHWMPIPKLPKE